MELARQVAEETKEQGRQEGELKARAKLLWQVRGKLEEPKGWFFRRCPKCNGKLKKLITFDWICPPDTKTVTYWACACGYEWVEAEDWEGGD